MLTIEQLVEQLEAAFYAEYGLVDPTDWDTFTAWELLQVIAGHVTLHDLVWGTAACERIAVWEETGPNSKKIDFTPESMAKAEGAKLVNWNAMARR